MTKRSMIRKNSSSQPRVESKKSIPRRSVLSDETYEAIRTMIFRHEISPGSRVNIDALSSELQVSQTPIREALSRLESEGLILKEPLKGFSATNLLTLKEFNDMFQFRLLVEPWAAEESAKKIDLAGKAALRAEMQSAKTAMKFRDTDQLQALTEHDARFHSLIANLSGNISVAEAFERTHCHLHLFRLYMANNIRGKTQFNADFVSELFSDYYFSGSGHLAIREHGVITEAIVAGNTKLARTSMQAHIENSLRRFSNSGGTNKRLKAKKTRVTSRTAK